MSTEERKVLSERKEVGPGLYLLGVHLGSIPSGSLSTEETKTTDVSMFLIAGTFHQRYQESSFTPLENSNDSNETELEGILAIGNYWNKETH